MCFKPPYEKSNDQLFSQRILSKAFYQQKESKTEILKPIVVSSNEISKTSSESNRLKPPCEISNNWKLVKLKSSTASEFSKAWLRFIIVIVQNKTYIVQSMQIVKSAARLIGETVSK